MRYGRPPASAAIIAKAAKSVLIYRSDILVGIVSLALRVVLVHLVWQALYAGDASVAGIGRDDAIGYAILGAIFNVTFQPWHFSSLMSRVSDGTVVFDLIRPVGLITLSLGQQFGAVLAGFPRALIGMAVALALGAVPPPTGVATALAFVVSSLLGLAIALLCNLLVAMTAFWTTEIYGAIMVYHMAAAFCSGALIPLWFMPGPLATALSCLPFSAQVFTPLSIYLGREPDMHTLASIGGQLVWVVALAGLSRLVWRRALLRVVIHGG
ncbi:ABC transporter permease [Nonomuraea sp. SBT364]|uniref:ABC transporter permease n=1 Tax=Nonomuraea sp. SBT364 TaxID=1580530 RepID=UPI00066CBDCF|nr:ABC-2 family transporter protein [Nonomuraea sp. SBT364]